MIICRMAWFLEMRRCFDGVHHVSVGPYIVSLCKGNGFMTCCFAFNLRAPSTHAELKSCVWRRVRGELVSRASRNQVILHSDLLVILFLTFLFKGGCMPASAIARVPLHRKSMDDSFGLCPWPRPVARLHSPYSSLFWVR